MFILLSVHYRFMTFTLFTETLLYTYSVMLFLLQAPNNGDQLLPLFITCSIGHSDFRILFDK